MKSIKLSQTLSQLVSQVENEICKEELRKLSTLTEKSSKIEQSNNLKVGTAFSGMGCPEYALKLLGVSHSSEFVIEWNEFAQETLIRNYNPKTVYGDITKVTPSKLSDIDLFVFGSPCQDLSTANRYRTGLNGSKSKHFFNSLDIIKEKQPKYVIFENVVGLLSSNGGEDFKTVLKCFKDLGNYNISSKVINPVEIGGNTTRKRVFVVLIRKDIGITFNFPKNSGTKKCIKDCLIEGEYDYLPEENFIPWEKSVQEQRGYLRKSHRYTNVSREDRQRVYDINYSSPTIQRDGKVLINDGIGFRYLSNEELKLIQGFGKDLDMSHLSSIQMKSQLGNTMEVETMIQLLGEIVRINNLHTSKSVANNVDYKKEIKRGRPLKKTVISNNHINVVKKITNTPDLEYLNLTESRFNEYKSHLDNGGTMSMTVEFYKNTNDKKNGKIKEKLVINIYDLVKLGFRDKKNAIYRVKITSKTSNKVEKVGERNVLISRNGGKGKFESKFDYALEKIGAKNKKYPVVLDAFFGGGGITYKNIEKLNFDRYVINDLEPLIYKTFLAVKKNPQNVIKYYQEVNNHYYSLISDELRNTKKDPNCKTRLDPKLQKIRDNDRRYREYYQEIGNKLNNHKDMDISMVAGYFIFFNSRSNCGILDFNKDGSIDTTNCDNGTTLKDKTQLIINWSYLLNSNNVEIFNKDVFEILNSIPTDSLIFSDSPYISVEEEKDKHIINYGLDNSVKFQLNLKEKLDQFKNVIYSNEHCKRLYDLGLTNNFSGYCVFPRNNSMGKEKKQNERKNIEFLGYRGEYIKPIFTKPLKLQTNNQLENVA